jgi:hypothetical protein
VYFLPPYSPFLNPIEYGFNTLKAAVQRDTYTNQHELIESIKRNIPVSIDADDAEGFYNHSGKFYPQCLLGLPFTGKPLDPDIINSTQQPSDTQLPIITTV